MKGKKCGRLTVIGISPNKYYYPNGRSENRWICQCDCGKIIEIRGSFLRNGNSISCGCYRDDKCKQRRHLNTYIIHDDYIEGVSHNQDINFFIDKEDFELIKDYTWTTNKDGYMVTRMRVKDKYRMVRMHRLIMGVHETSTPLIDHINRNKTDNRKNNLRFANKSINAMNSKQRESTTGICGVYYREDCIKPYSAHINIDGKRILLGRFNTLDEAAIARKQAEQTYYDGIYSQ